MTRVEKNIVKKLLKFDWVLDIKIDSLWLFVIMMPPLNIISLYKIGRLGEKILNTRRNRIFQFSIYYLFLSVVAILIILIVMIKGFYNTILTSSLDFIFALIFVLLIELCWIYCTYYAMKMSIKIDETENEDYQADIWDKSYRFFLIMYWPIGIWLIQPKLNDYNKRFYS